MRGLLVAVSALLLVAAVAVAAVAVAAVAVAANQQPDERFSTQDVERAFGGQGLEVGELTWVLGDGTNDDKLGVSSPELASGQANVKVLFELPAEHAEFYVFVAANSEIAHRYYERLTSLGPTPDAFDVLRGNVVVTSDSSVSDRGLSPEKKARIRSAMAALSGS